MQCVQKQTPEICLESVKQNGLALQYVQKQTPEICLEAVKENGCALKYVKEQSSEICLAAVKENIYTLKNVKDSNVLNSICSSLNILYLPSGENHRSLILKFIDGEYKCWIGCQEDISVEKLIWRIHNTDGGLKYNPHRQHYIDFLKEHKLYNVG